MQPLTSTFVIALGPVAVVTATAMLFIGFLFGIYRFLRWLWRRLPSSIIEIQKEHLDKTIAVLLSLAIFPSIVLYAWNTIRALVNAVPEMIQTVGSFQLPSSCRFEDAQCLGDLSNTLTVLMSRTALQLVAAIDLKSFPAASFIWFLLSAVTITQVVGFLRRGVEAGRAKDWGTAAQARFPVAVRQRIIFALLVLFSFYLGLSALLAIPLFQDKSRADQLSVDALSKALDADALKADVFDATFPVLLPAIISKDPDLGQEGPSPNATRRAVLDFYAAELRTRENFRQDLQTNWTTLRTAAVNEEPVTRSQARYSFASGLEAGSSKRQTTKHYYDLLLWHRYSMQEQTEMLSECINAIRNYVSVSSQSLDALRSLVMGPGGSEGGWYEGYQRDQRQPVFNAYTSSREKCQPLKRAGTPVRPSVSELLGPVGVWSGWLLDTEQMPVVIIVGLVGFSLLGATVSRAVRAGDNKLTTGISLDDLLIVIAGGTTAAVVVFLGAYGGLAILGSSGGDPNPYIVFATCLMGAIYSEDVWTWAHRRLLPSADSSEEKVTETRTVEREQPAE
jgi:hypothetical protein